LTVLINNSTLACILINDTIFSSVDSVGPADFWWTEKN